MSTILITCLYVMLSLPHTNQTPQEQAREVVTVAQVAALGPVTFVSHTLIYKDRVVMRTTRGLVVLKKIAIDKQGQISGVDQTGQSWQVRIVKR